MLLHQRKIGQPTQVWITDIALIVFRYNRVEYNEQVRLFTNFDFNRLVELPQASRCDLFGNLVFTVEMVVEGADRQPGGIANVSESNIVPALGGVQH